MAESEPYCMWEVTKKAKIQTWKRSKCHLVWAHKHRTPHCDWKRFTSRQPLLEAVWVRHSFQSPCLRKAKHDAGGNQAMQSWLDHDVFYERIQSEKKQIQAKKCQKQVSFFPSWSRTLTAFGSRLPTAVKLYKVISRWCSSSGKAICKCQYMELNRKERLPFEKELLRTPHPSQTFNNLLSGHVHSGKKETAWAI